MKLVCVRILFCYLSFEKGSAKELFEKKVFGVGGDVLDAPYKQEYITHVTSACHPELVELLDGGVCETVQKQKANGFLGSCFATLNGKFVCIRQTCSIPMKLVKNKDNEISKWIPFPLCYSENALFLLPRKNKVRLRGGSLFVSLSFAISHHSAQDDIQNDVKGGPSVVYNVDAGPYGLSIA